MNSTNHTRKSYMFPSVAISSSAWKKNAARMNTKLGSNDEKVYLSDKSVANSGLAVEGRGGPNEIAARSYHAQGSASRATADRPDGRRRTIRWRPHGTSDVHFVQPGGSLSQRGGIRQGGW